MTQPTALAPLALRSPVTLASPAKLNLFLEVTGRRADGYHLLDTLMVPIDLGETVTVGECGRPGSIAIACTDPTVPTDRRNTCWKAVDLFRRAAAIDRGIGVAIHKTIPHGAGLGGGSGNAAVVLLELNRRYGGLLAMDDLNAIAARVGADVPYFLEPVPTRCTGIGEIRAALGSDREPAAFHGVLAVPAAGAETAAVFKAFAAAGGAIPGDRREFGLDRWTAILYKERTAGQQTSAQALSALLFNRLRDVAERVVPDIQSVRAALLDAGSVAAEVTGSGSGVFAVCESSEAAGAVLGRFVGAYRGPLRMARAITFPARARAS